MSGTGGAAEIQEAAAAYIDQSTEVMNFSCGSAVRTYM